MIMTYSPRKYYMDNLNPNCLICTTEFHNKTTGIDHESIERAVFNGWSYRNVARRIVELEGGSLHAWEQLIRKHCIRHAAYGCPICSVVGENLINRWAVEKALRESKDVRKVIELKEYFLLCSSLPNTDPTSTEMIQRLEFHRNVCMFRYRAKNASETQTKKSNGKSEEMIIKNEGHRQSKSGDTTLSQTVL